MRGCRRESQAGGRRLCVGHGPSLLSFQASWHLHGWRPWEEPATQSQPEATGAVAPRSRGPGLQQSRLGIGRNWEEGSGLGGGAGRADCGVGSVSQVHLCPSEDDGCPWCLGHTYSSSPRASGLMLPKSQPLLAQDSDSKECCSGQFTPVQISLPEPWGLKKPDSTTKALFFPSPLPQFSSLSPPTPTKPKNTNQLIRFLGLIGSRKQGELEVCSWNFQLPSVSSPNWK